MTENEITQAARRLADELHADIISARDRETHIRLTARANSALELANALSSLPTEEMSA